MQSKLERKSAEAPQVLANRGAVLVGIDSYNIDDSGNTQGEKTVRELGTI